MHVVNYYYYNDYSKGNLKTERQWNLLGFKVKNKKSGEEMWTNGYCQQSAIYYRKDDVEPMTDNDKADFHEAEKKKKRDYYHASKEKREQEIERTKKAHEKRKKEIANFAKKIASENKKIVIVRVKNCGNYAYICPASVRAGTEHVFPFGLENDHVSAEILAEVNADELTEEEWFPDCIKEMIK